MKLFTLAFSLIMMSLASATSMLRGNNGVLQEKAMAEQLSRKLMNGEILSNTTYSLENEEGIILGIDDAGPYGKKLNGGESLSSEDLSFRFIKQPNCPYSGGTVPDCYLIQHNFTGKYLRSPVVEPFRTVLELVDADSFDASDIQAHWRVVKAHHVECRSTTVVTECLLLYNVETFKSIFALQSREGIDIGVGRNDRGQGFSLRYEHVWNLTPN